ncbi:MAG: hypothetical protein PHH16_04620 [Candidatus Gracilibacteria bacterium]|nr:hypothetical protein [Candidatus Gracilibacteria bacterium]
MSHIKHYIEKSVLIPPNAKETMSAEGVHGAIEKDLLCFMDTYTPMEKEILEQVNRELETLNAQMRNYLRNKEAELKRQEVDQMDLELAYL